VLPQISMGYPKEPRACAVESAEGRSGRRVILLMTFSNIRYGGWYSDMDSITVAKTDHLENVVASSGDFVANGNLT
jgi:hypothetical protein